MTAQKVDDNGIKEAAAIIIHLSQAIEEHKQMQNAVESYFEKNGVKQQYENFMAGKKRKSIKENVKDKKMKPDIPEIKKSKKEPAGKEVKRAGKSAR